MMEGRAIFHPPFRGMLKWLDSEAYIFMRLNDLTESG